MHWSCIDEIVLGFKLVEELYPSPPLGVDNADTSQLPKEKNLQQVCPELFVLYSKSLGLLSQISRGSQVEP
jgi:hypothetical protein